MKFKLGRNWSKKSIVLKGKMKKEAATNIENLVFQPVFDSADQTEMQVT